MSARLPSLRERSHGLRHGADARITRAQSMDVLSSQANIAGYRAVIDGAAEYGRVLPMMMTPAGTVPAARISSWASASPVFRPSPPRAGSAL